MAGRAARGAARRCVPISPLLHLTIPHSLPRAPPLVRLSSGRSTTSRGSSSPCLMPSWLQTKPHRAELLRIVHAEPAATEAAIERLVDLALLWESPGGLRPLSGVGDALRGDDVRRRERPAPDVGRPGRPPRTSPPASRRSARAARALLEHVAGQRRRGHHRHRASDGVAGRRRDPGRGADRPPAAHPARRRPAGPARRGRDRAARRPHHDHAARPGARARDHRARRGARRPHRRRVPPSTSYAASSCCSTTGASSRPATLRSGGLACPRPEGDRRASSRSPSPRPAC